jgi:hypothetical protein
VLLVIVALVGAGLALREPLRAMFESTRTGAEKAVPSQSTSPAQPPLSPPAAEPSPSTEILPPESGRLAFEVQHQRLGEEEYQLVHLPSGEYQLRSQGFFSLQVVGAEVKFEYTQEIQTSAELRPISFSLEFRGPLGLGNRSTRVHIEGETALVTSGENQQEVTVPQGRFALLGMFSSYALATKFFAGREHVRLTVLVAAGLEGPGDQPQDPKTTTLLFPLEATKLAPLTIRDRASGVEGQVEQYQLRMDEEDSEGLKLLVMDGEFLGLLDTSRAEADESFQIWRLDLFPQGFEVVPLQ